jgi:hypothetical protein
MIHIVALINEATQRIKVTTIYTKKFMAPRNKYLSNTEKIRIDEMNDHFISAGIVGRDQVLPILNKDGFKTAEMEPDIIGGQFPYSAGDLTNIKAGVPTYTTDGKEIGSEAAMEAKYAKMAAASIINRLERQCADAYLKGTYTDKDGTTYNVGVTSGTTLSFTDKVASDEVIKKVVAFRKKYVVTPKVEAGINLFNAIKNEAKDAATNINGVSFQIGVEELTLSIGSLKIVLLEDATGTDGNNIDTSSMLILSDPNTLAVGYGCLVYGDTASNASILARAEKVAGELKVEEMTGGKGLWAKSAPMPVLANTSKFNRYSCTNL